MSHNISKNTKCQTFKSILFSNTLIYDVLRDFVSFAPFKKHEKHHGGVLLLVKLQAFSYRLVTLLHRYFSRFWNCANGTKSRKTSRKKSLMSNKSLIRHLCLVKESFQYLYKAYKAIFARSLCESWNVFLITTCKQFSHYFFFSI